MAATAAADAIYSNKRMQFLNHSYSPLHAEREIFQA